MKIKIDLHSFVDLITNSSTTVYVMAGENTITWMKELINSILKNAGSDKTADELYEFKLVTTCQYCDEELPEPGEDGDYYCEKCEETIYEDDYPYGTLQHSLIITSKVDGETRDIVADIFKSFDIDGFRDG